jgi:abortive infection bacteriophage resistance protein
VIDLATNDRYFFIIIIFVGLIRKGERMEALASVDDTVFGKTSEINLHMYHIPDLELISDSICRKRALEYFDHRV